MIGMPHAVIKPYSNNSILYYPRFDNGEEMYVELDNKRRVPLVLHHPTELRLDQNPRIYVGETNLIELSGKPVLDSFWEGKRPVFGVSEGSKVLWEK